MDRAISRRRDKMQSELLSGAIGAMLVMKACVVVWMLRFSGTWHAGVPLWFWAAGAVSVGFAVLVWVVRSASAPAAAIGGVICMNILLAQAQGLSWSQTAMPALVALFVLTFAATRFGRQHKEEVGTAEPKGGRRASQVIANLGVAGLCAGATSPMLFAACIAALAEATADTVSSEVGQALGGRTLLITRLREVPSGTDGGISVAGTTFGAAAAGAIILVTSMTGDLSWQNGTIVLAGAIGGLLFDSYLGATVERRGWLGNDLVNLSSTIFAAVLAYAGVRFLGTV